MREYVGKPLCVCRIQYPFFAGADRLYSVDLDFIGHGDPAWLEGEVVDLSGLDSCDLAKLLRERSFSAACNAIDKDPLWENR